MNTEASTKHDPYAALKSGEFRLFLSERVSYTLAIQIEAVVVGWQVYQLTGDTLSLGIIGLTEAIPSILVALYAGHIADIVNRKKIILTGIAVLLLCTLGLAAFSHQLQGVTRATTADIWPIYLLIFIIGLARGFIGPAHFAFMPQLLPKQLYSNGVSWNSTFWQGAAVGGPALGGLLYSLIGPTNSYLVQSALLLLGIVLLANISSKPVPEHNKNYDIWERLTSGIRFVFGNQLILSAISLDLFAVLFGGAVALLPAFAKDVLLVDETWVGLMRAAPAFGSVVMAFLVAHYPITKNAGRAMLLSVAGFGLCMILFALSTNVWLSLCLLVMSGVFDSISVIVRGTLLQLFTPEDMKGRVSAVNNIFIGSSNEIGAFESGAAARLMGLVPSVVFGGIMTLIVVAFTSWRADKLRKLNL